MKILRVGSRSSLLAQWQANHVREQIATLCGIESEIVLIKTSGDRFEHVPVNQIGLKGIFIKELEDQLLEGQIDLAVHSVKDVPTETPRGLTFPAILRRQDVRDCIVSATGTGLAGLRQSARIGTSSLRRQSQLRHHRPDLDVRELRGNVDTRVRKVDSGEYDAVVLAKAGLDRLGMSQRISEVLSPQICLPAVGQGTLGIETRSRDRELNELMARLEDAETRSAILAERALLAALQGGCLVPIGGWARMERNEFVLEGCVASIDGTDYIRERAAGPPEEPEALGQKVARALLDAGAVRILETAGRQFDSR
ncbi:MAG TPA: hydroxymethylbilane synthase [Candidatus Dormibacteraeota bacterium]|nr:hydroxymethylbilane synthase [Candidatus Dormibacteraeota bacterium]